VTGGNASVPAPSTPALSLSRHARLLQPRDVHNTLIACGPRIKPGFSDSLPSGNVDLAPTIAELLGLSFNAPDGRVLREAIRRSTRERLRRANRRSIIGPAAAAQDL